MNAKTRNDSVLPAEPMNTASGVLVDGSGDDIGGNLRRHRRLNKSNVSLSSSTSGGSSTAGEPKFAKSSPR